nr:DUF3291 domain-containing protein [Burkholderia sp. BCC1993]
MQGFVAQLKDINALAERSWGFVWRLQTSKGYATGIRGFDDPLMLLNMSLWESVDSLRPIQRHGPTPVAFGFRDRFVSEGAHRLDSNWFVAASRVNAWAVPKCRLIRGTIG